MIETLYRGDNTTYKARNFWLNKIRTVGNEEIAAANNISCDMNWAGLPHLGIDH